MQEEGSISGSTGLANEVCFCCDQKDATHEFSCSNQECFFHKKHVCVCRECQNLSRPCGCPCQSEDFVSILSPQTASQSLTVFCGLSQSHGSRSIVAQGRDDESEEKAKVLENNESTPAQIRHMMKQTPGGRRCGNCSVSASTSIWLKLCSGCMSVYYCSDKCQKFDWKTHKSICKRGRHGTTTQGEPATIGGSNTCCTTTCGTTPATCLGQGDECEDLGRPVWGTAMSNEGDEWEDSELPVRGKAMSGQGDEWEDLKCQKHTPVRIPPWAEESRSSQRCGNCSVSEQNLEQAKILKLCKKCMGDRLLILLDLDGTLMCLPRNADHCREDFSTCPLPSSIHSRPGLRELFSFLREHPGCEWGFYTNMMFSKAFAIIRLLFVEALGVDVQKGMDASPLQHDPCFYIPEGPALLQHKVWLFDLAFCEDKMFHLLKLQDQSGFPVERMILVSAYAERCKYCLTQWLPCSEYKNTEASSSSDNYCISGNDTYLLRLREQMSETLIHGSRSRDPVRATPRLQESELVLHLCFFQERFHAENTENNREQEALATALLVSNLGNNEEDDAVAGTIWRSREAQRQEEDEAAALETAIFLSPLDSNPRDKT